MLLRNTSCVVNGVHVVISVYEQFTEWSVVCGSDEYEDIADKLGWSDSWYMCGRLYMVFFK
jgi:hypothetical protein